MGRGKRKNKLQLKSPNDGKNLDFSQLINIQYDENTNDENDSENFESVISDPVLLSHINDIQNVNEHVLLWDDDDVIDQLANDKLYGQVDCDMIKRSIRNSHFGNYLNPQLRELNQINPSALCGVIMRKNCRKACETPMACDGEPPTEQLAVEGVDDRPGSEENISPGTAPPRRSGRSVKINYLDMINCPIFDHRARQSDGEAISPSRRAARAKDKKSGGNETVEGAEGGQSGDIGPPQETVSGCIECARPIFATRSFTNLCYKCSCAAKKLAVAMRAKDDLVCIAEPPCWALDGAGGVSGVCGACSIQALIEHGLQWGPAFKCFYSLTTDELRRPLEVARVRLARREQCQAMLDAISADISGQERSGGGDLCVLCEKYTGEFLALCRLCACRLQIHLLRSPDDGACADDCADCSLTALATDKAVDLHAVATHRLAAAPAIGDERQQQAHKVAQTPPVKRARTGDNAAPASGERKAKRRCNRDSLVIDAKWEQTDGRSRRTIKPVHYDDFIVDERCLPHAAVDALVNHYDCLTSGSAWRERRSKPAIVEPEAVTEPVIEPVVEPVIEPVIAEPVGMPEPVPVVITDADSECRKTACRRIKQAMPSSPMPAPSSDITGDHIDQLEPAAAPSGDTTDQPPLTVSRHSGPRVKQVSRQSAALVTVANLDTALRIAQPQKCVVKRVNRASSKRPDKPPPNIAIEQQQPIDTSQAVAASPVEQSSTRDSTLSGQEDNDGNDNIDEPVATAGHTQLHDDNRCGICAPCARNRSCGKCDACLLNKSQRRRTEMCLKMICVTALGDHDHDAMDQMLRYASHKPVANNRQHLSDASVHESTDNADKSVDEVLPSADRHSHNHKCSNANGNGLINCCNNNNSNNNGNIYSNNPKNTFDVYRDSDSDDLSSEEEQLDPELDNIQIVKSSDMITTGLAHEGGFPVITSFKAQPNKVLCFSCGSGGDQMIHCVSCAEPFHFFCIEFQFRPKSKEMFVCRNCTKCHSCDGYGSDLKCIKCQLGFHPSCVDRYPPSRSEDKSDWACYKCAMCLHCGAKAEDVMLKATKAVSLIDWSRDPWQCGRCARARKDGHVCPECGRAYQTGLETVECRGCSRRVHRQCSGLTEDEYELLKMEPPPEEVMNGFACTKCSDSSVGEEELRKRVRLKRLCKESGLKIYCDRGVTRRMSEYIHKGETHEELLLEQYHIAENAASFSRVRSSSSAPTVSHGMSSQVDGADDELAAAVTATTTTGACSPLATENHTSSTVCNSSESIGEYDMEQLSALDLDSAAAAKVDLDVDLQEMESAPCPKIGIFSRLNASDYLSPKHLLMEALARITIKLSRYHSHSQFYALYDTLLHYLQQLSEQIFPWLDFGSCVETVHSITKRNSGRMKLVLQAIGDVVRESGAREFDVFSSSIWEIEEKLANSFRKGRDEFIVFHSEQHLAALMRHLETRPADGQQYTSYRLAFEAEDKSCTVCEKDVRRCALCRCCGDDGLEGRLIYGGLDVWVHVNCALWSDEVYEREDGALVNVEAAIKRGESTLCSSCNVPGATIRCSADDSLDGYGDGCHNIYHFGCAFNLLTDPVFTESRTFYCSEMHEIRSRDEQQLGLADMLILRRIYMLQGCLSSVSMASPNGLQSHQIVVAIGNLRIDSLGCIEPCSDSQRTYLCPVGYQARRLYWSMHELDSLVMYYMTVKKELNKNCPEEVTQTATTATHEVVMPEVPIVRRRRMIETVDSRLIKRSKPSMECRQDVVYEMDEDGNLKPISGPSSRNLCRPVWTQHDTFQDSLYSTGASATATNESKKVNRRFPINAKSGQVIVELSSQQPLKDADKCANATSTSASVSASNIVSHSANNVVSHKANNIVSHSAGNRHLVVSQWHNGLLNRVSSPISQAPQVPQWPAPAIAINTTEPPQGIHMSQPPQGTNTIAHQHTIYRTLSHHQQPSHQAPITKTPLRLMNSNGPPKVLTISKITPLRQHHIQHQHQPDQSLIPQRRPFVVSQSQSQPRPQPQFQQQKPQSQQQKPQTQQEKVQQQKPQSQQQKPQSQQQKPLEQEKTQSQQQKPPPQQQKPQSQEKPLLQQQKPQPQEKPQPQQQKPQSQQQKPQSQQQKPQPQQQMPQSQRPQQHPSPAPASSVSLSNTNKPGARRILKLVRVSSSMAVPKDSVRLSGAPLSNVPVGNSSSILTNGLSNGANGGGRNSPSVLRTVLTDKSQTAPKRAPVRTESPYFISSCGSLSSLQSLPPFAQYDGQADDCSLMGDTHVSGAGSVCSDQEYLSLAAAISSVTTASANIIGGGLKRKSGASLGSASKQPQHQKPKDGSDYKFSLRFVIHGFKGSKSPKASWTYLVRRVTQLRKGQGLTEYALKTGDGWAKYGLEHRYVVHLVEQMVSAFQCRNYEFKFHKERVKKLRDQCSRDIHSPFGCARFTPWRSTKPSGNAAIDPLGFLHCKSNRPPKNHALDNGTVGDDDDTDDSPEPNDDYLQKLALQFRNLQNGAGARQRNVRVCCSDIHGRGLFARRGFEAHEVIIEYVGEVIRSVLSDVRETEYQKTGLDCYMFRLDQGYIVDATFRGNAARFINHSCRPNCYAKVVRFEGDKHIIIIAQRKIFKGEELTYNYRFPIEDDKLVCTCGSFSCKKYLN